jgi:hypothetical protein
VANPGNRTRSLGERRVQQMTVSGGTEALQLAAASTGFTWFINF